MTIIEYYAKDHLGNELYKASANGHQYYANIHDVSKVFAKKANGKQYYAKSREGHEFYPYISQNQIYIIQKDGTQIYAKRNDGTDIYPRDVDKKDIVLKDINQRFYYAKDANGNEIYPKLSNGKQYMLEPDKYAMDSSGNYNYPLNEYGKPIYPVDVNGNELYILKDNKTNKTIFGKDSMGNQIYAKDGFSNEYYPDDYMVAKNCMGDYIYAFSDNNQIIYPKNTNGNEYYLKTHSMDEFDYLHYLGKLFEYAKRADNREIYPKKKISQNETMQVYLKSIYAKNENGEFYYPRDEYGNEYLLDFSLNLSESEIFVNSYPITKESFYIIPNINGQAYVLSNVSNVDIKHIIAQLYRHATGYKDYLTNVKSNRKPLINNLYKSNKTKSIFINQINKYQPLDLKMSSNISYYIWAIFGLLLLFIISKIF